MTSYLGELGVVLLLDEGDVGLMLVLQRANLLIEIVPQSMQLLLRRRVPSSHCHTYYTRAQQMLHYVIAKLQLLLSSILCQASGTNTSKRFLHIQSVESVHMFKPIGV